MLPIQILIAEDHALLADALQMLLGTQADMRCVGVVKDGEQALAQTLQIQPDLLLLDLGLPRLDGLGVMEGLQRAQAPIKVLVVTARLDEQSIRTALSLGAAGYLPKNEDSEELLQAIRRVAQGKRYISADIARLFVPEMHNLSSNKLTSSETTVLHLVGEGFTSKEISQKLGTSEATARKHRENIRRKLGVRNSAEMAAYAIRIQGC
jgi:DNA-binding NarL/FixJ family response regulator